MSKTLTMKAASKFSTIGSVAMFLIALLFTAPFLVLIVTTFKDEKHVFDPFAMPDTRFDNYRIVFASPTFFTALMNTLLICTITLVVAVIVSSTDG